MGDILYPLLIRVKWGNNKYIRSRMFKKLTFYIRLPHTNISTDIFRLISQVITPVLCWRGPQLGPTTWGLPAEAYRLDITAATTSWGLSARAY